MKRAGHFLILLVALLTSVSAHQIAELSGQVEMGKNQVQLSFMVDAAYSLPEFRGDEDAPPQDLAWLRQQSPAEWKRIQLEAGTYFSHCLKIVVNGHRIEPAYRFPDFDTDPPRFVTDGIAEMPPMIEVAADVPFEGGRFDVAWDEPFGVVLILVSDRDVQPVISGQQVRLFDRPPSLWQWIRLGWQHIIPAGLDHILFILGIFLLTPSWKPLLKQSLTFTLAHSATLVFAALGWVHLPTQPIEIAIALSISWIALENFGRQRVTRVRYLTIAGFGLVHGLGFASMLVPLLPPGRPDQLIYGIAGFNLGVEAGQVAVLAAALASCGWWTKFHFDHLRLWGSLAIAFTGIVWAIQRAVG
ncbi:HupE/UreJ family protein [Haloferula sargassicola]|uniref:HupE/UreJ family protein n=1 Tax=Haloferula sargassicola TaxID=490096 RepID=A0ABP9UPK2_9BACT